MKLFSTYYLGAIELKNRVALAPLTRSRAGESRIPNRLMSTYYCQRASAGLLISEATSISIDGLGWLNSPGLYNNQQVEGWSLITDDVKKSGGVIFAQLWHCGRASHSTFSERNGSPPLAPSPIAIQGETRTTAGKVPYEVPKEMSSKEIEQTILDYASATKRAKLSGFHGIELHAANGYLIDQFLQSKTNKRTDAFGGNIDKRLRFLREIVLACSAEWGPEHIGVRLAPNGSFNDMGSSDFRETFLAAASLLEELGVAYLHIMDGLAFGFHDHGKPMNLDEFRQVFSRCIIGNCGYTKESAENAIQSGAADLIAFGRPFIANPDLVERFRNDLPLAAEAPVSDWYSFGEKGYTDYPPYSED